VCFLWARLRLWTAATNGHIVHPPYNAWVWRTTVEWYWQGKTEELGEEPFPMPLCPPQIPHGLTRARTWDFAVRSRRLTAWAMARPLLPVFKYSVQKRSIAGHILSFLTTIRCRAVRCVLQRCWPVCVAGDESLGSLLNAGGRVMDTHPLSVSSHSADYVAMYIYFWRRQG
jgi:hypothetical protein